MCLLLINDTLLSVLRQLHYWRANNGQLHSPHRAISTAPSPRERRAMHCRRFNHPHFSVSLPYKQTQHTHTRARARRPTYQTKAAATNSGLQRIQNLPVANRSSTPTMAHRCCKAYSYLKLWKIPTSTSASRIISIVTSSLCWRSGRTDGPVYYLLCSRAGSCRIVLD